MGKKARVQSVWRFVGLLSAIFLWSCAEQDDVGSLTFNGSNDDGIYVASEKFRKTSEQFSKNELLVEFEH